MADQAVTLRDKYKFIPGLNNQAQEGFNYAFKLDFAATDAVTEATPTSIIDSSWTTDGDTVTVTLFAKTATQIITKAAVYVKTAVTVPSGTGSTGGLVGSDGDPDDFITATAAIDLQTAGFYEELEGANLNASATDHRALAADNIVFRLTTDATTAGGLAAPADITAGEVWVLFHISDLNNVANG